MPRLNPRLASCLALLTTLATGPAQAWIYSGDDTYPELLHDAPAIYAVTQGADPVDGSLRLQALCSPGDDLAQIVVNVLMHFPGASAMTFAGGADIPYRLEVQNAGAGLSSHPSYGLQAELKAQMGRSGMDVPLAFVGHVDGDILHFQSTIATDLAQRAATDAAVAEQLLDEGTRNTALMFSTLSAATESLVFTLSRGPSESFRFAIDARDPSAIVDAFWEACTRNGTIPVFHAQ